VTRSASATKGKTKNARTGKPYGNYPAGGAIQARYGMSLSA